MKINSINSVLSLNYKNFAQNNNQVTNPLVNEKLPISDNYGRAMVNFKASGAKNIKNAVLKAPLEDKVSAIVQTLQQDELLIISSNLRKSLEMFKENLRVLDFPVKKILHIQEPRLSEILAFTLQDDYGNVKIYNVNEEPIEIIDLGIPLILDQGERQTLGLGGIVKSSLGNIMLKGESDSVGNDDIEKYMSLFTKEIDFDNQMTLTTLQHNKLILSDEPKKNLKKTGPFFKDVGGQDEVIDSLKKNMLFPLKHPEVFEGFMLARGAVLYGEPGTGKTFLADAFVNESGATQFRISGTELAGKYVGESEKNCRELFASAVESQPSVIFIDEFDALGKSRGNGDNYNDKLLNQFLSCTSDLEKRGDKVIILGSTNRIEDIDPAILRSGRFDLHLEVKKPDLESTKTILNLKTKGKPLDKKLNKNLLAEKMFSKSMTGADIYRIVRDAHINALTRAGIYESMENGTYTPELLKDFVIKEEDFNKAIDSFKAETKERKKIGF